MLALKSYSDVVMTTATPHSCFPLSLSNWVHIRVIYIATKL